MLPNAHIKINQSKLMDGVFVTEIIGVKFIFIPAILAVGAFISTIMIGCGPEPLTGNITPQPFILPSLSGTVFDRDKQMFLQDAEVRIAPGGYTYRTDQTGRFLVPELSPGTYMASVRAGLELTSVDFSVTETAHFQILIPFGNGERGRDTLMFREDVVWMEKQSGDTTEHSTPLANLQNFRQIEDIHPFPFDSGKIVFAGKLNPADRFELYMADLSSSCLNCVEKIYSDTQTLLDCRKPVISPDGKRLVFQQGSSLRIATMGLVLSDVSPLIADDRLNWQKIDSYGQLQPSLERDRISEVSSAGVTSPAPRVAVTQPALCTAQFSDPIWHPTENLIAFLARPTDTQAPSRAVICSNIATVDQLFILSVVANADFSDARQITRDTLIKSRQRFNAGNDTLLANLEDLQTSPSSHFLVEIKQIYTGQYTTVLQAKATAWDYDVSTDGKRLLFVGTDSRTGINLPQIMEGVLFNAELFLPVPRTHYRYTARLDSPRYLRFWPRRYSAH